jgi:hypothetical protein
VPRCDEGSERILQAMILALTKSDFEPFVLALPLNLLLCLGEYVDVRMNNFLVDRGSPRRHSRTFREALSEQGSTRFRFQMLFVSAPLSLVSLWFHLS